MAEETKTVVIARSEIKKGDRVRVTYPSGDSIQTVTGTAFQQDDGGDWFTEGNNYVTNRYRSEETVELFPKPLPKLPTDIGSIVMVKKYSDTYDEGEIEITPSIAILDSDGDWALVNIDPDSYGTTYLSPDLILDWNPTELTVLPHEN